MQGTKNIVHINTMDVRGGAAKMAWRLLHWQRESDKNSNMLVGSKEGDTLYVYPFPVDRRKIDAKAEDLLYYDFQGSHELYKHPLVASADILHLHNLHGGYFNPQSLISLSSEKPVIWTLHDMQALTGHCAYSHSCERWINGCGECPDLTVYPAIHEDTTHQMWLDKKNIYEQSDLVIVTPSLWLKKLTEKSILGNHRVELIYNGVDTRLFYPRNRAAMREKYKLPLNAVIVGCVANGGSFGDKRKGGYYIRESIEHLKQTGFPFLFLNVGGNKDEKENYIHNSGYVEDENTLAELYSAMDLFLLPSLADNCPLVVSEAQACGIPIIGFDSGGIPELVKDGVHGLMAESGDTKTLISNLEIVVRDERLRRSFSKLALENALANYSHDIITRQYEQLYVESRSQFSSDKSKGKISVQINRTSMKLPTVLIVQENGIVPTLRYTGKLMVHYGQAGRKVIEDSGADIVYFSQDGFEPDNGFLETMLTFYHGEEILYCHLKALRCDGKKFYNSISPLINRNGNRFELDLSLNACILYRADIAIRYIEDIKVNSKILAEDAVELKSVSLKSTLNDYLSYKSIRHNVDQLYIYGAGSHTVELIDNVDSLRFSIKGIVDKNERLDGTMIHGIPVYHNSKLSSLLADSKASILLSSATYESEIYDELSARDDVNNDQIIRLYGYHN